MAAAARSCSASWRTEARISAGPEAVALDFACGSRPEERHAEAVEVAVLGQGQALDELRHLPGDPFLDLGRYLLAVDDLRAHVLHARPSPGAATFSTISP